MISLVRYCLKSFVDFRPSPNCVSQCKCVSKRWCTIISDPMFIGQFLLFHSDRGTPILHSLVDSSENELLTTKVFERLRSFLSLKQSSEVVATCNDLVLCSEKKDDRLDFFICNPRTMHIVTLPPTPGYCDARPLGFICEPYFEKEIGQHKESNFNVNAEYMCKVVRLFTSAQYNFELPEDRFGFSIQVFSSDTGEWRESVASCPRREPVNNIHSCTGFVSNGVLYWLTNTCLVGLDLFMINNGISTANSENIVDHYRFHLINFDQPVMKVISQSKGFQFFAVYRGCVRIHFNHYHEYYDPTLFVVELKEQDPQQMAVDSTRKLGFQNMKSYSLDRNAIPFYADIVEFIDDLQVAYLRENKEIIKFIDTARRSKIGALPFLGRVFQFVLPWWPTPVLDCHSMAKLSLIFICLWTV